MELLVDVVALEDRQRLGLGVEVLDPVGQLGVDRTDVLAHLVVQGQVVDDHGPVLAVELLADDPDGDGRLTVEEGRSLPLDRHGGHRLPLLDQPLHVVAQLLGAGAGGGGAHDQAVPLGADGVDDPAQPLALAVLQSLGDPVGRAVRHQHHEPAGQRDLLGQPGALGPDRVLGHLAQDGLARPQKLLDPRLGRRRLDVLGVVADVPVVEDGVLRRADVDEGRLHAGQHVLHPPPIDVPVDLGGVVRRPGDVVLDQGPPLEQGDLGHLRADVDADHVAPDGLAPALPPAPASFGPGRALGGCRADGGGPARTVPRAAAPLAARTRLRAPAATRPARTTRVGR